MDATQLIIISSVIGMMVLLVSLKTPLLFLSFLLFARGIIDSTSSVTYQKVLGPFSIGQMFSVISILIIFTYLLHKRIKKRSELLLPLIALVIVAFISTVNSWNWPGFIEYSVKWFYFYLLFILAMYVCATSKYSNVLIALILVSLYPVLNQLFFSLIAGPKCIEGEKLCSYIGSFYHESELASWILMLLLSSSLAFRDLDKKYRVIVLPIIILGVISLFINGYRTAILGFAVYVVYLYIVSFKKMNIGIALALFAFMIVGASATAYLWLEKIEIYINDIVVFISNPGAYINIYGSITPSTLFSGRLYLFNLAMHEYVTSGLVVYFFGIGPDMIATRLGVFAHNEFISALVELGIIGFFIFIWLLLVAWKLLKKAGDPILTAMFVCILVTALATMPFHDTRSIILLALLLGMAKYRLYFMKKS